MAAKIEVNFVVCASGDRTAWRTGRQRRTSSAGEAEEIKHPASAYEDR